MKNIIVVRLSSLGDIIMTQPVVEGLAKAGHQVSLLVQPMYADLVESFPGCSQVVTPDTVDKQVTYDLMLDLHGTVRSRRVTSKIRAKRKTTYKKYSLSRRLLVRPKGKVCFWNKWSQLDDDQSVLHWYAQAAQDAGFHGLQFNLPRLVVPSEYPSTIKKQLHQINGETKPIVVIAPGATWATKCWPIGYFIETARALIHKGYLPVFIGASEKEIKRCQQAVDQLSGSSLNLAGTTTLVDCARLLSNAVLFVGNDSGPMHLSLAVGTPTLAMFGPTVGAFGFKPQYSNAVVLEKKMDCRPCSVHGGPSCPLEHHNCMKKITPKDVLDQCWLFLEKEGMGHVS